MYEPDVAADLILSSLKTVSKEIIPTFEAHNRVLSRHEVSRRHIPPRNVSTLDGYAVKRADLESGVSELKVNGVIAAGDNTDKFTTPNGTAWRIMTGAALPPDTDLIIRYEDTNNSREIVSINCGIPNRSGFRLKGEEAVVGDLIEHSGERINAAIMAELTARGAHFVEVFRKPRVAVLSSGNEVTDPSVDDPQKIYDANSVAIKAILETAGCEVNYCGIVADEPKKLNETLQTLVGFDLIVSSGGISAGDFDYFARIPEKLGIKWLVQHVRQRPAQPVCYGTAHGTPFFALPGTPVGAFLCALLYVKPAARRIAGENKPQNTFFTGSLQESVDKRVECTQFNMAKSETVAGILKVTPYPLANYSLKLLAKGNSFVRLTKPKAGDMLPGENVDVLFF